MKKIFLLLFLLPLSQGPVVRAQESVQKRVGNLENRVDKVEDRVTTLEKIQNQAPAAADPESLKIQPLTVNLISKKQVIGSGQIGIKMVLEFKNLTGYGIKGFSGALVFKPEGGDIYTRRISYTHPIGSDDTAKIELIVTSGQTRQYLKFVKAKVVKVVLINQKLF
ncbi:MAG: hypothetical protein A2270_04350 [Elusimicrobia bacterium RIFOXYA12_FULL_51_18]|nr:MAG: hypothetical protein A2270_04350 [Elusimicrobia bacterium RIFOXYA12_FULL_51_18]OGS30053.1 MAG: hypothetical protein A2218_12975 [Elusimicrobia bacterium RIFOXYA2_FULL_53_38]